MSDDDKPTAEHWIDFCKRRAREGHDMSDGLWPEAWTVESGPRRFIVNPADDGPLLIPVLGTAAVELDAAVTAARRALDELEALLAPLEASLHAGGMGADREEELGGLGYAIARLRTETADLGRRRDVLADWLARADAQARREADAALPAPVPLPERLREWLWRTVDEHRHRRAMRRRRRDARKAAERDDGKENTP